MLDRLRIPGLGGWGDDPLWASFYHFMVSKPAIGKLLWRVGLGSDLDRLYRASGELAHLPAGATVLDIPCGGGVALHGLMPGQGLNYTAADISETMLRRTMQVATELGVADQVTPQVADVNELPFADDSFDMVVSFTGIHCFPDPQRAVAEIVRVLRPGGMLIGSSLRADAGVRGQVALRIGRAAGLLGPSATQAQLQQWLREAGCEQIEFRRSGEMSYFRCLKAATAG